MLWIAFGDQPAAPVSARGDDPPEWRWLAAVALGARGRYAAACALLDGVRAQRSAPVVVRAHATVTRAAHLRQLGGHLAARRWDGLGLALATGALAAGPGNCPRAGPAGDPVARDAGLDLAAARVDALLGLAADALGLAELGLAGRLLGVAERPARWHPSWRPSVRWHWVRAELALATDRPAEAAQYAERALESSVAAGATRHEIKSGLVLAVAEAGAGRPAEEVRSRLAALAEQASIARLGSLEWPIRSLLAGMAEGVNPAGAGEHRLALAGMLAGIRRHADPLARTVADRSPWVSDIFRASAAPFGGLSPL